MNPLIEPGRRLVVAHRGASADAAAAQAARDVLTVLYPAQQATFDAALAAQLALMPPGRVQQGRVIGRRAAQAVLQWRTADGWPSALAPDPTYVLPFFPEFRYAAEAVRGGAHGRLLAADFKRVISRPDWSAEIADAAKTGGPAVDLHIHDTHFIGLLCGVPRAVFATGVEENGAVAYLTTQYLYGAGGPCVTCSSGAVAMSGRAFVHGFEIYLEKATLLYDSGGTPLTLLTADGKSSQPQLAGGGDPITSFAAEIQAAANGVAAGKAPDLLSGQLARDALVLCHREIESVKTGRAVAVADPAACQD